MKGGREQHFPGPAAGSEHTGGEGEEVLYHDERSVRETLGDPGRHFLCDLVWAGAEGKGN